MNLSQQNNYKDMNLKKCRELKKSAVNLKKIQIKIGVDLELWI